MSEKSLREQTAYILGLLLEVWERGKLSKAEFEKRILEALTAEAHTTAQVQRDDDMERVKAFRRDCGCADAIEEALRKARLVTEEEKA